MVTAMLACLVIGEPFRDLSVSFDQVVEIRRIEVARSARSVAFRFELGDGAEVILPALQQSGMRSRPDGWFSFGSGYSAVRVENRRLTIAYGPPLDGPWRSGPLVEDVRLLHLTGDVTAFDTTRRDSAIRLAGLLPGSVPRNASNENIMRRQLVGETWIAGIYVSADGYRADRPYTVSISTGPRVVSPSGKGVSVGE